MKNKICFFLPTRSGSERVSNKNTRPFADIEGGILQLKLSQLLEIDEIPIIVSTNDPSTIEIASSFDNSRIVIVKRPENLCQSSTIIEDFINYIPTIVNYDHIFWLHTTTPFATSALYEKALCVYDDVLRSGTHDSLISVNKIQQFLWDAKKNEVINHDRSMVKWPRTQDLEPLYEVNHAFYISSRDNYLQLNDRIGNKPYLMELTKLEGFDIDWEDDFKMAELLYGATRKI